MKGLDLVRRDWSVIAKRVGRQCLSILLSDKQTSNSNDSPSESEVSEEPETPEVVKTLLGGVMMSDRVVTVSPSYREEICTPMGGWGLVTRFFFFKSQKKTFFF